MLRSEKACLFDYSEEVCQLAATDHFRVFPVAAEIVPFEFLVGLEDLWACGTQKIDVLQLLEQHCYAIHLG